MTKIKTESVDKCLLCNHENLEKQYTVEFFMDLDNVDLKKFMIVKCNSCGFQFISPRPTRKHMHHYYPSTCSFFHSKTETILDIMFRLLKKQPKIVDGTNKKVLDIGFGSGDYLLSMNENGWECYGIDTSEYAFNKLSKKSPSLKLKRSALEDSGYADFFFDHINMSAVIEHVHDPIELLKETYRLLKPSGTLAIMVPNHDGLHVKLAKKEAELFVPQHLSFFTPKTVQFALEKVCFQEIEVSTDF